MPPIDRLSPLPCRYELSPTRPGVLPWPRPPRSASAVLSARALDRSQLRDLPDGRFQVYFFDGVRWQTALGPEDPPIRRVAWVASYDQCIATPYDDEERVVPPPGFVADLEAVARPWAERWGAELELDVDEEAFKAEVERVRTFYTTRGIGVSLTANEAPTAREVAELLSKLGLERDKIIPTTFHFRDPDSGATEPILSASGIPVDEAERLASFRFVVDLETEHRAPRLRVDRMLEAAHTVCRELKYAMREEMTGASDGDAIRTAADQTIAMLEEDGMLDRYVDAARLQPAGSKQDGEPFEVRERLAMEGAGRPLRFRHERWSRASVAWLIVGLCAGAALWGYVSWLPGAFAAVFGVFLAQIARLRIHALLDARTLQIGHGRETNTYRLPIRPERFGVWSMERATPWRDADGKELVPHPSAMPGVLVHALTVRSAVADVSERDRVVLEAIDFADLGWRGRREGYVGAAISPDGTRALGRVRGTGGV